LVDILEEVEEDKEEEEEKEVRMDEINLEEKIAGKRDGKVSCWT